VTVSVLNSAIRNRHSAFLLTVSGSKSAIRNPHSGFLTAGQAQEQQFAAFFRQAAAGEPFDYEKRCAGKSDRR
jgi:hypothetical protein